MRKTYYVLGLLLLCAVSYAGIITHTDYISGNVITATGQNANENTIVNEFNGSIDNTNIKVGGIASSNLPSGLTIVAPTLTGLTSMANVKVSSNVAIGTTTTPTYALDVLGDARALSVGSNFVRGSISNQISEDQASAHFSGAKARGTPSVPTAVVSLDYITGLAANPFDGTSYLQPGYAGFQVSPSTTVSTGRVPTDFLVTTGTGTPADGTERLRVDYTGHVGINRSSVIDPSGTLSVTAFPSTCAGIFTNTDNTFTTVSATNNGNAAALTLTGVVKVLAVAGTGAPPNSFALCFLGGVLGHCSSAVGAGGGCTCSTP